MLALYRRHGPNRGLFGRALLKNHLAFSLNDQNLLLSEHTPSASLNPNKSFEELILFVPSSSHRVGKKSAVQVEGEINVLTHTIPH